MSWNAAILQTTTLQAVTQIRGSGDYVAGGDTWRIGGTSLSYSGPSLKYSELESIGLAVNFSPYEKVWDQTGALALQWSLPKIVNHCGIHSVICGSFATCLASCVLNVAKQLLMSEWMPQ